MAAYSGPGNFPYWMSISNNGATSNAGVQSENVPVSPGGLYTFTVIAAYQSTYASGAQAVITIYDSGGNQLQQNTATQASMTGGAQYQWTPGQVTAPAGSSYAILQVLQVGLPSSSNALQVYSAELQDGNNNQVNLNYAFTYASWPWTAVNSAVFSWNFSPLLSGDSDSLVLGHVIELMGGVQGVQCDVPELLDSNGQGPTFRILAPPSLNGAALGFESSYDLNFPQPTQDVVASMLLDGERPFGARASNRTINLPVIIFGTQAGGMAQVLRAREYLAALIDKQTWQIKWTSADTGLPMIFDCFRAIASPPVYGFNSSSGGTATGSTIGRPNYPIALMTLNIQALPYGRSDIDGVQNLAFTNSLIGGPQPLTTQLVDNFSSVGNVRLVGVKAASGTSFSVPLTGSVPAGDGIIVAACAGNSTAQTFAASDSKGNTYTSRVNTSNASAPALTLGVLTAAAIPKALTGNAGGTADSITVTTTNSEALDIAVYAVTQAVSLDTVNTGTGSSTSPAATSTAPTLNNNVTIAIMANNNTQTSSTPANWTSAGGNSNGAERIDAFWITNTGQVAQTATGTYSSSSPWLSAAITFDIKPGYYWIKDSNHTVSSAGSAHFIPPRPVKTPYTPAVYSKQLASTISIAGLPVWSVWFGQAYDTQWPKDPKFASNVRFAWTLTDVNGVTLSFSTTFNKCQYGSSPSAPKWTQVNAYIPQGNTSFNYNAVAAYSVKVTNYSASGSTAFIRMHAWLNGLYSNPQSIQNPMSPRGSVYNLFSLPGTARSPVSVQCQLPAAANVTQELTTPVTGNWIVPPGVFSVQAEAWAGGGAGAALNLSRAICGAGGGGGEYAQEPALNVTPGQKVPWSIGSGGTPGQIQSTVIQYSNTGLGHWTCPANVTSLTVEAWGGGAAAGAGAGGGGGGEYAKAKIAVTPGVTYPLWVGTPGKADTGTSSAQVAARQGGTSWFGTPGTTTGTTAFTQALGGKTSLTGASSGGYGGTSGTVAPQTQLGLIGFLNSGSASTFTVPVNFGTKLLPAGNTGMLVINTSAAVTVTVTDSSKNVWTQVASSSNGSSFTYVFWCLTANQLNASGKVTVTFSGAHAATFGLYNVPWVCGQDVAFTSSSGSSTSPSVTSGLPTTSGDLVIAVFSNNGGANTNSTPAGWTSTPNLGTSLFTNVFAIQNPGTSTETATSSYASSQVWNGIALTFSVETHYAGGRGGASPGPSGGGGGGAAGATGVGGTGGDSQPFVTGVGRWQQGGTGGTGTGLGGNGGAGAGTPGFPGVGVAPGGGGGGGYQTPPLYNPSNPSKTIPGQQQVNYLGGDGGAGMVQLTYAVGGGSPVNGGNTSFGSAATTGTIVTAHGGTSAANNSAAGAAGGTGSSNTIHANGGPGGLAHSASLGSYMLTPTLTFPFQSLASMTYTTGSNTSGTSGSSCAQGAAVVIIESAAPVTDLAVTDSAGNVYQLASSQAAQGATGATAYAYVANIEFPVTTSTTLTVASATAQQYGVIWYASPYLASGVSAANTATGHGTSASFSGQFGVSDTESLEVQLGVLLCDGSKAFSAISQNKTWAFAGSTFQLTAGTMQLTTFVMGTQGGGTGAAGSGDILSGTLTGSANWSVLCVPLILMNQQAQVNRVDWRSGTTPGSQTTWATEAAISANGLLVVVGQAGSGSTITSGPSAITDASGNTYTFKNTTVLGSNGGVAFLATAPVTAALAAGTTGLYKWGTASAAPNYWTATYWIPNATTGIDPTGVSAVTGSASSVTGSYTPTQPNEVALSFLAMATVGASVSVSPPVSGGYNFIDSESQNYLAGSVWGSQLIDEAAQAFSATFAGTTNFALLQTAIQMQLAGTGGGGAGGPANTGYPGVWQYGGAGFAGAGKGGAGAGTINTQGGGAALPGGGGGGAYGNTANGTEGGQGAQGAIRLTWTPPLQVMNDLIVHSLGPNTDPNVNPLVPIPITDTPNNTEYLVPSLNGLIPATFSGSYSVILANYSWNNATSSSPRQVTVTINQYEYPGGPRYSTQVSRAVTPATDAANGLLSMGEVTLPIKDYVAYNDQSYFTVSINDTDTSDRFMDVLFLDTTGQTVLINIDFSQPGYNHYVNFFIDEPTVDRDLGFVGASMQDRQHQVSVLDYSQISGALYIAPGDNLFLVYSTSGAPNLSVTYAPRWYLDRSVLS